MLRKIHEGGLPMPDGVHAVESALIKPDFRGPRSA